MSTPSLTPPRPTIRLTDAAMRLRVSYHAAHRLLMIGQLEGRRERGNWLIYADSVDAALQQRGEQSPATA